MLIKKLKYLYSVKFCSRSLKYIFPAKTNIRIKEEYDGMRSDFNNDVQYIGINPISCYTITFEHLFPDSLSKILSAINNINNTNDKMNLQIRKNGRIITAYNLNMISLNTTENIGNFCWYDLNFRADWVVYDFL